MPPVFRAVPVTERIYWVGAIDWELRNFHGYLTSHGTTYNAYLVVGDPVVLIDTVKAPFKEEMLSRIASVVDPRTIRVIVSNHSEMDHSGVLPDLVSLAQPEQVIASAPGARALKDHFHWDREIRVVKDGEVLSIGDASFRFVETRMLHWPDSMFCYFEPEGVLFTNDAFGMHLASSERFADEIEPALLRQEAAKYFANILLPYSKKVTNLLNKLPGLSLDVRRIAPDHGPIWRHDPRQVLDLYAGWAAQRRSAKVVIIYDTMWHSTALMARAIAEGVVGKGIAAVKVMPLDSSHRSDVATEILDAGALLVGSPTLNNEIYPTVADVMTYLKGLHPTGLLGASFGSHGWSGQAVKHLDRWLTEMGVDLVDEGVAVQYVPDEQALERCRTLGARVADRLEEMAR